MLFFYKNIFLKEIQFEKNSLNLIIINIIIVLYKKNREITKVTPIY